MLAMCNGYPAHIYVAIMFYNPEKCGGDGGNFETMGWWSVAPGSCVNVYANDLEDLNRYWYYYAQADDGAVWAGPYRIYAPDNAFSECGGLGISTARIVGMRELDIGDNDDYTLTFVP
jgi:uncharacterized membrane protein